MVWFSAETLILDFCFVLFVCCCCFLLFFWDLKVECLLYCRFLCKRYLFLFLNQWHLFVKNERQTFPLKELWTHVEITTATRRHFKWARLVCLLLFFLFCLLVCLFVCFLFCLFFVRSGYDDNSSEGTDINQWFPSHALHMYIAAWWHRLIEMK